MAALVVALVNLGVEWDRRNCLKTRFANKKQTAWLRKGNEDARTQHEQRLRDLRKENPRLAEFDCVTLRERVEARCRAAQIRFQLDSSEVNRQALATVLAILDEYGKTL